MNNAACSLTMLVVYVAAGLIFHSIALADSISEGRTGGDEEEGRGQPEAHARHLTREAKIQLTMMLLARLYPKGYCNCLFDTSREDFI